MYEISIVILLIIAIAMIALILVQQGKGAGMGASFGAGASNTVFGATGSGNFLTKTTWFLVIVFFALCLFIGWLHKSEQKSGSEFENLQDTATMVAEQQDDIDIAPTDTQEQAVDPVDIAPQSDDNADKKEEAAKDDKSTEVAENNNDSKESEIKSDSEKSDNEKSVDTKENK